LVDMNFTAMDFGYEFDDNAFDVRKNMAQSKMEVPAMAQKGKNASFNVYLPTNVPDDVELTKKKVESDDGVQYVFQYSGEQSFTLMEQRSQMSENGLQ